MHPLNSCDILVPGIDILIDSLPVSGNAQFIIALRQLVPKRISDQIIDGRLRFLLIGPVVKLCDLSLDPLQQVNRHLFDFLDTLPFPDRRMSWRRWPLSHRSEVDAYVRASARLARGIIKKYAKIKMFTVCPALLGYYR